MPFTDDFRLITSGVGLTLLIIFALIALIVIFKLFRLAIRWLRWSAANAAGDTVMIFICFAIAAYFYPYPLTYLASSAWGFLTALLSYLPSQLQQQLVFFQSGCSGSSCLNIAVVNLANSWTNFLSSTFTRVSVSNFPLTDAIMFTAIWLGLTKFFGNPDSAMHLFRSIKRQSEIVIVGARSISHTTRLNMLFFFVLIISSYLCLTSIIAIPSLLENTDRQQISSAELRTRLQAVIPADFNLRFPLELSPGNRLEKNAAFQNAVSDGKGSNAGLVNFGNDLNRRFSNVDRQWRELRENFGRDQTTVLDLSAQTYELNNKGRKGERETQQHLLNIGIWYHRWWADRAGQLNRCKADMERFASSLTSQFEAFANFSVQSTGTGFSSLPTDILNEMSRRLSRDENDAFNSCTSRPDPLDIPTRADFGGYLGVFGLAASWLLKTESLPLVLITGLLGFGLLGAACSSVIRNVPVRARGEPLVPNLAGVVIRGTSAAVLIFLAVFGGLAVFTGSSPNPNPYVVLFTCLAAAVFSEDAWSWGAQQFRSRLRGGRAQGRNTSANRSGRAPVR